MQAHDLKELYLSELSSTLKRSAFSLRHRTNAEHTHRLSEARDQHDNALLTALQRRP